jgi:hypothetical protein
MLKINNHVDMHTVFLDIKELFFVKKISIQTVNGLIASGSKLT